jgi:hypothetical protein
MAQGVGKMKFYEYIRHKELIEAQYKRKMEALKITYPEEWAKDHERKEAAK